MKDSSELLLDYMTFSEGIVVLEELTETDAVLLYLSLELEHEISDLLLSNESSLLSDVLVLLGLVKFLHGLFEGLEGSAIVDELEIPDLVVIGSIDGLHGGHLLVGHGESEVVQSLAELLGGHFEVLVAIPVLKEALWVKSVPCEPFSECTEDHLDDLSLVSVSLKAAIESLSAHIIKTSVNGLFKVLLCEDFINSVTEVSPANVAAFLWCTEVIEKRLKFLA